MFCRRGGLGDGDRFRCIAMRMRTYVPMSAADNRMWSSAPEAYGDGDEWGSRDDYWLSGNGGRKPRPGDRIENVVVIAFWAGESDRH